jgi:hypothetical protein
MQPKLIWHLTCLTLGLWLALVQPGLSSYWLLDPHTHAQIDADRYGQEPDGEPLPGRPWHPPHEHPSSGGLPVSSMVLLNAFDAAFYQTVFLPAQCPALRDERSEAAVLAKSVAWLLLEHPPCA